MKTRLTAYRILLPSLLIPLLLSCEDEVSPIGGSLVDHEVQIKVDSAVFKLPAQSSLVSAIDARSTTTQIGRISIPEYGELSAEYVTQLMAAANLNVADSIGANRVDSTKLVINIPRSEVYGDTLAPQQLTVYRLIKSLPTSITSDFNPEGFYDPNDAVNSKNYTLSGINLSDSAFSAATNLNVNVTLPVQWGRDAFNAYRSGNTEIFQWPNQFCRTYPGLYIKSTFGRGAIANVKSTKVMIYYHYFVERTVVENDVSVKKVVTVKDSVSLFSSTPEVLSSSIINFKTSKKLEDMVASGRKILTAPLGYRVNFTFPAADLLNQYWAEEHNLSIINNLTLSIPAVSVSNTYGLVPPPEVLMIKRSKVEEFFANNEVPDNVSSFRGTYSSDRGQYEFASMRQYIVDLAKNKDTLTQDDIEFVIIPVNFESELVTQSDGSKVIYLLSCTPFLKTPAMAELLTDRARIVFTYTSQLIK